MEGRISGEGTMCHAHRLSKPTQAQLSDKSRQGICPFRYTRRWTCASCTFASWGGCFADCGKSSEFERSIVSKFQNVKF